MIFVPSIGGISHNPAEATAVADIQTGFELLCDVLKELSAQTFYHGKFYYIANDNKAFSKELFHMTDTYVIDVQDPGNALDALMFVLAIDAEKCSRN